MKCSLVYQFFSDIDECMVGSHDCDDDTSTCTNSVGSFDCTCNEGYEKNSTQDRICTGIIKYFKNSIIVKPFHRY